MSQSDLRANTTPGPNDGTQVALLINQGKEDHYSSFGVDGALPNTNHFDQTCQFLAQLTLAAYGYGSEGWRLQHFLSLLTTSLGYQGVFHLTPTAIVLAVQPNANEPQRVQLLDYPAVSMDFSKLVKVEEVALNVLAKKTSLEEAPAQLVAIDRHPHPWGKVEYIASFPAIAVGVAAMCGGCWWDVLVGAVLSVLVAVMTLAISGDRLPFIASMVTALITTAIKVRIPEIDIYIVTLSAIMILIPGLPIMSGTGELASSHNVLSGIVAITNGVIYCLYLIVGAWFGYSLVSSLVQVPSAPAQPVNSFWIWILFPVEIWGFCACTLIAPRDMPWAALNCLIGYFGGQVGTILKDSDFGAFVAGILVFMFGNIWCNKAKRPAAIVLVPVLYYLVPTSPFHVFAEMTQGETKAVRRDFSQMFMAALLLEAGFVVGNAMVPQKKISL